MFQFCSGAVFEKAPSKAPSEEAYGITGKITGKGACAAPDPVLSGPATALAAPLAQATKRMTNH